MCVCVNIYIYMYILIPENVQLDLVSVCRNYNRHKNADDQSLLANTPAKAESQLHGLEQAAGGTSLYMNANKT